MLCFGWRHRDKSDLCIYFDGTPENCCHFINSDLFITPLRSVTSFQGLLEVENKLVGLAKRVPLARSVFTRVITDVIRVQIKMIWTGETIYLLNALTQARL